MPTLSEAKATALAQKCENYMIDSFTDYRSKIPRVIGEGMVRHNLKCRDYVRELTEPKMDRAALEIAALLHNIERAFKKNDRYPQFSKLEHETKSAEIAGDFLRKQGAPKDFIEKVKKLIKLHEKGGKGEAQVIAEADNIAFLESTLPIWFEVGLWMGQSKEELINLSYKKVESEWKAIKSKRGRELAKKYYDKWQRWLEQKEEVIKGEQDY